MNNEFKPHNEVNKKIVKLLKLAQEDPDAALIAVKVGLIRTGVMNADSMNKQVIDESHSRTYDFRNKPKRRIRKK